MQIGFDAKRAFRNATGLGNYSRSLISALQTYYPQHTYWLYTSNAELASSIPDNWLSDKVSIKTPASKLWKNWWRTKGMVRQWEKDKLTIFHGLSNELPWGSEKARCKKVVTIHDVIFKRYPAYYPYFDRQIYHLKTQNACRVADKIIAVSEQTKRDLIRFYGVPAEKITVIYQSCHPIFQPLAEGEMVSVDVQLPENFFLTVGTVEERKNLGTLVKALRKLPQAYHLVVVGNTQTRYAQEVQKMISDLGLTNRVHFLKNVGLQLLRYLYSQCIALVYPSAFEGFGIPILEAISVGAPVIAASGSCLEEAGGHGSLYCAPFDDETFSLLMLNVAHDAKLSADMRHAGWEHARKFTPQKLTDQLVDLYEELCLK